MESARCGAGSRPWLPVDRRRAIPTRGSANRHPKTGGGSVYQAPLCAHHPLITAVRTRPPPLIGIVTHDVRLQENPAWGSSPGRSQRDRNPPRLSMRLSYTRAIQEAGGIAVVLPAHGFTDDIAPLLDRLDGLLFSGGPGPDPPPPRHPRHPATYGHERHPLLGPDVDRVSDEYELAMLREAGMRELPMLAICRGMHALNVARGGTLHQHLPDLTTLDHLQGHEPSVAAHPVVVSPGSLLHRVAGATELPVNSFHHQAADAIGAGLDVCARAPDGTVEALWDPAAHFCLGVQWHAELLTHDSRQAALLDRLVDAARGAAPRLALVA